MSKIKQFRPDEEDLLRFEWIKDFFGFRDKFGEDSQTLKQAIVVSYNVLQTFFGDNIKDIFQRGSRDDLIKRRAIQYEKLKNRHTTESKKL